MLRSAASLAVADTALKATTALVTLIIARAFGPHIFGLYATAMAVCGVCLTITALGFEQELTRRGGRQADSTPEAFVLNLIALAITCVVAFGGMVAVFLGNLYGPELRWLGVVLALSMLATRFFLPFRGLTLVLDQTWVAAVIQSLSATALIASVLAALWLDRSLFFIACLQLALAVATLAVWTWWTPKKYFSARPSFRKLVGFFRSSSSFALSSMIWIAYFHFDTFMLSLFRPQDEVGVYAGAFRIVGIVYILGYAAANAATPALFAQFESNRAGYGRTMRQLLLVGLGIGLVLAIGQFVSARPVVWLTIGRQYETAIPIVQLLSAGVLFRMLNSGLCEILTTSNRQTARIALEGALLATNVGLNLALIPHYGGEGAALATVCAEIVLFVGCAAVILRSDLRTLLWRPANT